MGKLSPEERAAARTAQADRRRQVAELAADRMQQQEIARLLGVSEGTVSKDLAVIRKGWLAQAEQDVKELTAEQAAALDADETRLRALFRRRLDIMEAADQGLAGALIYHLPEGEKELRAQVLDLVAAVQDVRPLLRVYDRILAIMTRRAKLYGLDPEPAPPPPPDFNLNFFGLSADAWATAHTQAQARVSEWREARQLEAGADVIDGESTEIADDEEA